ncbi:putative leucine-rich repeat protein (LRRP) [Trypanosoma conorhini]|uniref:Putative leucine-rich repeat protein (LRRP) n=1 Tax=Trypanosoma conorhini TaxID=83891 RepID=A0A3R7N7X6_9TRYP|nr:putative leucine-rich repeat protein (LRRP) [Trypanosoma conorhini]RNF26909.1 putative leucine-rich repeat protein (LRRP) [Trypanosoma conorhini]
MRRVAKGALAVASTRRWRWSLHEAAACPSLDALRLHLCQRAKQETEWDLDFALLPSCAQPHASSEVLRCCCAAMASAADSVKHIALTVTSAAVAVAVGRMLCTAQAVSLHTLHLTLYDVAFLQDDSALATLLQASSNVSYHLTSLRITIVTCDLQRRLRWSQQAVRALAANIHSSMLQVLSLEYVDLHGVSEEDMMVLCEAIARGRLLTQLSLRGSRGMLARGPLLRGAVAGMRQLGVLDLSSTLLGDVALEQLLHALRASVGGWCRLRHLNLAETNLSAWGLQRMLRDVGELPPGETASLVYLNLNSNGIDDEGVFFLASACMRCELLRELHVRHNRLTKRGAAALGSALLVAASLRCLNLHSNPIGDEGLRALLRYAKYWPELRVLDVTRCRLTAWCIPSICAVLPLFDRLEEIALDRNDLRPLDAEAASALGDHRETPEGEVQLFAYDTAFMQGGSRGDSKVPTSFELDRRDAADGRRRFKGTEAFVKPPPSLETIGGVESFAQLGLALSGCRGLRRLTLSSCSLTDASFLAVAGALVVRRLTQLDLSANPLFARMDSLEALATLLRRASVSLQALDLSCTGLGNVGASLLADGYAPSDAGAADAAGADSALRALTALQEIRLSNCRIGADGFEALADAFPAMTSLQRVFLDGNAVINPDAAVSLLGALAGLPSLRFVGLYGSVPHHLAGTVEASRECLALRSGGVIVHV